MSKLEYADMLHERRLSDEWLRRLEQARARAVPCVCGQHPGGVCKNCQINAQFARTLAKFRTMTTR